MVSFGFYKGDRLLVANNYGKLAVFEKDGQHIKDIPLPFQIVYYNWTQRKKIYSISDEVLLGQIYKVTEVGEYEENYLNFIDLREGVLTPALPIPEESKYKDGQYYGSVYPFVSKNDSLIYMLLKNEAALHVYEIEGMTVSYRQSVGFGGEQFVEIIPSNDKESFGFERNYKTMRPGEVLSVFDIDDYLITS